MQVKSIIAAMQNVESLYNMFEAINEKPNECGVYNRDYLLSNYNILSKSINLL